MYACAHANHGHTHLKNDTEVQPCIQRTLFTVPKSLQETAKHHSSYSFNAVSNSSRICTSLIALFS